MARSRAWCWTLNNYTEEDEQQAEQLSHDCRYLIFGHEVGENNTPHLQGYLYSDNKLSLAQLHPLLPRAHFAVARGSPAENQYYCSKEGDFSEFGQPPLTQSQKGDLGAAYWDKVKELAIAGDIESIDSKTYISHYRTLKQIAFDHQHFPDLTEEEYQNGRCNLWLWGPTRTGKSYFARQQCPDFYLKTCNKWWDNYQGESVAIIEDFDKSHACLAHHIKIWADRYAFPAEIKNYLTRLRPKRIIITSNYSPDEIFTAEQIGYLEPIRERFHVMHFNTKYQK